MSKLSDLHSQRNATLARMTELTLAGIKSKADKDEYRKLADKETAIAEDIATLERIERYFAANPAPVVTPTPTPVVASPAIHISKTEASDAVTAEHRKKLNEAFRVYLRNDSVTQEMRDLLTTSDGAGGAVIPQQVFPVLGEISKYYCPILERVTLEQNTTGRPTQFITEDDTANFLTVASAEGTAPTETDPTYSKTVVFHDLISGIVKASVQLFDDSGTFDLTDLITKSGGKRLGRSLESIVTKGVDPASNAAPNNQGILSAATLGTTTSVLANGLGESDLAALAESLDPSFWAKAVFMMSSGVYLTLLQQKDGFGQRYWPELGSMKLWNWDVVINNTLTQTLSASSFPILFGDLSTYGVSYTGLAVQALRERFADKLMYGFVLSSRVASQSIGNGIVKLKLAAS